MASTFLKKIAALCATPGDNILSSMNCLVATRRSVQNMAGFEQERSAFLY